MKERGGGGILVSTTIRKLDTLQSMTPLKIKEKQKVYLSFSSLFRNLCFAFFQRALFGINDITSFYWQHLNNCTVNPPNFTWDLILLVSKIHVLFLNTSESLNFTLTCVYSESSRLAKFSICKNWSKFQFAKLSPRKIKVLYSISFLKMNVSIK